MKKLLYSLMSFALVAFTLTSCEDIPAPYALPGEGGSGSTPSEEINPEGTGTAADPFNVAGIIEYTSALGAGEQSAQNVYFKGKIVSIKETPDPSSYGNATFYISDDGTSTKQFYVYRCYGPENKKFTSADQIKVGDEVLVCGLVTNYGGNTPETVTGKAYVVSINGSGSTPSTPDVPAGDAKGDGTLDNPFNPAGANAFAISLGADKNSDPIYVKGKISSIKEKPSSQYGNATFYISEDGTSSNEFYVFRCYNLGNVKFTDADADLLKVGDEVVIYGPIVNYKGNTPETVQNKAYIYSLNGKSQGGGSTTPDTPTPPAEGNGKVTIDGTNVILSNASATAGTESVVLDLSTLGYENAADVTIVKFPDGTTATFDAGTNKNAPKYYTATNGVRVYANNTITFSGNKNIASIVFECDSYNGTDYVGNATATVSFNGKEVVYCNASSDAGTQLRVKKITIVYAK